MPQMLNFPWASSPDPGILSEELEVGGVGQQAFSMEFLCFEAAILFCDFKEMGTPK